MKSQEKVTIGIRREDKNVWERRVPLTPDQVSELKDSHPLEFYVQPSSIRVYSDREYEEAGARVVEDLSHCSTVFAVKELPLNFIQPGKTYVFFSHTIKGQPHNMPMLRRLMEMKCTLIDYEKIVDHNGKRLIFFGWHAGVAGMIDTLWAFGKRLEYEGIKTPFSDVRQTYQYRSLTEAKEGISSVGKRIQKEGLHASLVPLVCGFAGYGNVFRGAEEIINLLPVVRVSPDDLVRLFEKEAQRDVVYTVVFRKEHTVEPISTFDRFDLREYTQHPERYRSRLHKYVPYLSILVNCIYWEKRYPRILTKEFLKELFTRESLPRLRVIGDLSCDIEGGVECTVRATDPGNPVYVYDPLSGNTVDGVKGKGVVVLAVDNLPCELAREASSDFGEALKRFVPVIASVDRTVPFDRLALPPEIKEAVILYHGELTPKYRYLEKHVRSY